MVIDWKLITLYRNINFLLTESVVTRLTTGKYQRARTGLKDINNCQFRNWFQWHERNKDHVQVISTSKVGISKINLMIIITNNNLQWIMKKISCGTILPRNVNYHWQVLTYYIFHYHCKRSILWHFWTACKLCDRDRVFPVYITCTNGVSLTENSKSTINNCKNKC